MQIKLIFVLIVCCQFSTAQVHLQPSALNFGTTNPETEWVVDVHIKNLGVKKDYVLRTTFSHEYEVLFTSKTLLPDSTIVMRVKFSPRMKEEYKEKIEIYFASRNEPVILPVHAIVEYLNPADHIPCPNFSTQTADCCPDNFFMVEVVDDMNGRGISNADIKISEEGRPRMSLKTGSEGKVTNTIPISFYKIEALHADYESAFLETYINHRKAYFTLRLKRKKTEEATMEEVIKVVEEEDSIQTNDSTLLDATLYASNNVVFLLDVSSSMLQGEKLSLMKEALEELTKVLRVQDKITLVSYADKASILLPTATGDQHASIEDVISKLHADGSTSGELGFKASYAILKKEFLEKPANNQLVVITDGVFQPEDQKRINQLVKKSAKKGITTTVVGIQCASFAIQKLTDVSTIGHGSFLSVQGRNDVHVLIDELKRRSAK